MASGMRRLCLLLWTSVLCFSGCGQSDRVPGESEQRVLQAITVLCKQDGHPAGAPCDGAPPTHPRRSVIQWSPEALSTARSYDRQPAPVSPLSGWPVLLKANIDTADSLQTTAGSLAMSGFIAPADAPLVSNLRAAGLIVVGKTNLSEWANFRSRNSVSGWSSIGGQTAHANDPAWNPCGSSSGSAVAVALGIVDLAVGTETDGSIICPSSMNGIVGIKPTLGLVSQSGIIPIARSQDTAGPMARTVSQAAHLLAAMAGTSGGQDVPSGVLPLPISLRSDALIGKRIGVIRSYYGSGSNPEVESIYERSLARLRDAGAILVDDVRVDTSGLGRAERTVLLYEFKAGINAYLQARSAPVSSLDEIIAFNTANSAETMPFFGQDLLEEANSTNGLDDDAYVEALEQSKLKMTASLMAAFSDANLDALVVPSNGPAWLTDYERGDDFSVGSSSLAAVAGFPSITVPSGSTKDGKPLGMSFIGPPWSDAAMIELAYAFEQLGSR
ncbi:MAG: amidase family protein [Pseudomonadota bacterium]